MQPGHEGWVTRDYGGEGKAVTFTRKQLGEFLYWVMMFNGKITDNFAMAKVSRAYCQFAITLPIGKKEEFEAKSGFTLEKPPVLKLA